MREMLKDMNLPRYSVRMMGEFVFETGDSMEIGETKKRRTINALLSILINNSYKGMFPCFLAGLDRILVWVISNAWISFSLVWEGRMISST